MLAYVLAVLLIVNTNDSLAILQQLGDLGLLEDLDAIGLALGEILELDDELADSRTIAEP